MSDLSVEAFDLRPFFNDTVWPAQIGAGAAGDQPWWKKASTWLIICGCLITFLLGVIFVLHNGNKQQSALLDKLEQNMIINSAIEDSVSKTAQYFVGVVTFVGGITVILIAAVTIWIHSNIPAANNVQAATEAMEPQNNDVDVDVDNIGGQQQILQVPLETAVWWQYLSAPISKGSMDKRHKCTHCPYSTHRPHNLKIHMFIHTEEKPHECQHCGQQFRLIHHLTEHQRVHTGEKPFKCQHCGKQFRRSHHLSDHQRVHTGEKPFICNDCEKVFTTRSGLKRHLGCVH